MNERSLFEEKIVPERKLNGFELAEKQALAKKHGVRQRLLEKVKNKPTFKTIKF